MPDKTAEKPAKRTPPKSVDDEAGPLTGKKAPDFALPDQSGKLVKLSDFAGKWLILYFYPKDDTPGCTTEACDFTAGIQGFRSLSAEVIGCSPDKPETHKKFIAKYALEFPLLSDATRETLVKYAAWGTKNLYGKVTEGVLRSTVVIDPEGVVAHHFVRVKAAGHADQVRARLAELQATDRA